MPIKLNNYIATVHNGADQHAVFVRAANRKDAGHKAVDSVRRTFDLAPSVQLIPTIQEVGNV